MAQEVVGQHWDLFKALGAREARFDGTQGGSGTWTRMANKRWTGGRATRSTTPARSLKEMEHAFRAVPEARDWTYNFQTGAFRDKTGQHITDSKLKDAVLLGDPKKSGIGASTLRRAVITHAALNALERGTTVAKMTDRIGRTRVPRGLSYLVPGMAILGGAAAAANHDDDE